MSRNEPLDPIAVDARFNGGALIVETGPLPYEPTTELVTVRGGATDLALFAHEARHLARALTLAADHADAALAAERRRAPDREARSASHLERMESAEKNVAAPSDIDRSRERDT